MVRPLPHLGATSSMRRESSGNTVDRPLKQPTGPPNYLVVLLNFLSGPRLQPF